MWWGRNHPSHRLLTHRWSPVQAGNELLTPMAVWRPHEKKRENYLANGESYSVLGGQIEDGSSDSESLS